MKHQKGNSRRSSLLDMRVRDGVTEFMRTDIGEFFHDVVLTRKDLKYLARKWEEPIAELRNLRKVGVAREAHMKFKDPRSRVLWRSGRVILKGQDMTDLRREVFKRAQGRCEVKRINGKRCNKFAPFDGYGHGELAHIIARGRTGTDTAANCLWSCRDCHRIELHPGPQFAAERRRRAALGQNLARPSKQVHG